MEAFSPSQAGHDIAAHKDLRGDKNPQPARFLILYQSWIGAGRRLARLILA